MRQIVKITSIWSKDNIYFQNQYDFLKNNFSNVYVFIYF